MTQQNLQSLSDLYFKYTEKTEPPMIFHRWSLLSCLAASLGRQYYLPFADFRIFPNMYVMLIGDPGTRKSTAIKTGKRILSASGYDKFSAERTSKEKFLLDLEGVEDDTGAVKDAGQVMRNLFGDDYIGADPREVFVVADEFNEFVGSGNLEFLSLLGSLWDWDDPSAPFKQRLKTSRSVSIFQPTLNILSGNTHAGFAEAFPPQAMGQGFLSRLILVFGESSGKKFAFPEKPSEIVKQTLIDTLVEIKTQVFGEATMTSRARDMLQTIYHSFEGLEDARFKHYSTRRYTHLLKLCLLSAAASCRTEIRAEDVLFANTLLTFTEHKMPNAMGEFGKAKNADVAARIISVLGDAKGPIDTPALWKQVQSDLDKPEDLNKLLIGLVQGGKIQYVSRTKTGNAQGYLIVRKLLGNKHVYTDFSLLKENGNV
jgi:hypothetical protein